MTNYGAGIHEMPMETYLADPCPAPSLSSGLAHTMATECPLMAWLDHPRLNPDHEPNQADPADIGTVAHQLLIGGDTKVCVINPEDYRSKPTSKNGEGNIPKGWTNDAIKAARDEARANGLTPILYPAYVAVKRMADEAKRWLAEDSEIPDLLKGQAERVMLWEEGGFWFRARPDVISDAGFLVHYKTTEGRVTPAEWIRQRLTSMGYDMAISFYERGAKACGLDLEFNRSVFLVQSQTFPYSCFLVGLGLEKRDIADRKTARAIGRWQACLSSGEWPGYAGRIHWAEAKGWEHEEQDIADIEEAQS